MGITLDQLLASREDRWHRQMMLVKDNPTLTLVCLTVIMPGNVKRNSQSLIVAEAALGTLKEEFAGSIHQLTTRDLPTGYEAYMLTTIPLLEAKQNACRIEDTHPLGRLFDVDVIDKTASPVSRNAIGHQARQCLLCDNDARYCMRNHSHSQEELLHRIDQMIDRYVQRL